MNNCSYLQHRINIAHIFENHHFDTPVVIAGFLRKMRKLGKLCFVNLADATGSLQLVFQDALIERVAKLNKESVICVRGIVKLRLHPNPQQSFGDYEMQVIDMYVLNNAQQLPPFNIDETINALEDTLLKYRYLELRSNLGNILQKRSRIINIIRQFFLNQGFTEITTPILGRSTPEGARDFLVPIRSKTKASGYALPQSPQLYKQLLMVGGLERYFQFATNFRDEDLRADRQPEFMQLDMEVSYWDTPKLFAFFENLFAHLWQEFFGYKLKTPFLQMSYYDSMQKYGVDKPDLRFELLIQDYTREFQNHCIPYFFEWNQDFVAKALFLENQILTKKQQEEIILVARNFQIKNVWFATYNNGDIGGSLHKNNCMPVFCEQFFAQKKQNGTLILIANKEHLALAALGQIRNILGNWFQLYDPQKFEFVWIVDWPLFEFDHENQTWTYAHNPFTAPQQHCLDNFDTDFANAKAEGYDLVLNGSELGSGAKRIIDPKLQQRVFEAIGMDQSMIAKHFDWFIKAYQYGSPPHQGLGLGIERLLQIMLGTKTIRDVIAFPKNNHGIDMMQQAPSAFDNDQLKILHLNNLKSKE